MRNRVGKGLPIALVAIWGVVSLGGCRSADARITDRDDWAAGLCGASKLGDAHFATEMGEAGKDAGSAHMTVAVRLRLAEMGLPLEVDITIEQWVDPETGRPIRLEASLPAGETPTRRVVEFGDAEIVATRIAYDGETTTRHAVPPDVPLLGELTFLLIPPTEGETDFAFYNIMADRVSTAKNTIKHTEDGNWSVAGTFSGGPYTMELDADGRFVAASGQFGVRFVAASEEEARNLGSGDYLPPLEFGIGVQVDRPLPPPHRVAALRATLAGLPAGFDVPAIPGRQSAEMGADGSCTVVVRADDIARHSGPALGYAIPEELAALAAPDAYLVSDDPAVAARAREIAGTETDASRVAEALCAWVDEALTFGGALDTARTSAQILESRRGVCRDYAALYAGMARSLGIPTRICTGLVYVGSGFYAHSWAESWLGEENGWVPLDPTRSGRPVDATHITFVRGGVESVWDVLQACASLSIGDIEVETDGAQPTPLPWPAAGS